MLSFYESTIHFYLFFVVYRNLKNGRSKESIFSIYCQKSIDLLVINTNNIMFFASNQSLWVIIATLYKVSTLPYYTSLLYASYALFKDYSTLFSIFLFSLYEFMTRIELRLVDCCINILYIDTILNE